MAPPSSFSPPGGTRFASSPRRPGRVITVLAVGFLVLDGLLLGLAGLWGGRPGLLVWGLGFGVAAVGVLWLRRRYLHRLAEVDRARDALRRELRAVVPPSRRSR